MDDLLEQHDDPSSFLDSAAEADPRAPQNYEDTIGDFVQNNPLATESEEGVDSTFHEVRTADAVEPEEAYPELTSTTQGLPEQKQGRKEPTADVLQPLVTSQHEAYAARYLGSVRLPEGDLIGANNLSTMTQCITRVTNSSKKSNKVIYEFKENKKVIIALEGRELKLTTDDKDVKPILCHPLNKIRAWAVGNETDSHHFAYVIRSVDAVADYSYVCRVFRCNVEARQVAAALRNICQQRAEAKAAGK